jgi:transcriptional regulator with XRE-family HTH domain
MSLGKFIRRLRKAQQLTLERLAQQAGISRSFLSKIENDKPGYEPSEDTLRALAPFLGVHAVELLRKAWKLPPEIHLLVHQTGFIDFLLRAKRIARREDWPVLLSILEQRHRERGGR